MTPVVLLWLAASPFTFEEISPASLALKENGRPVLVYNHGVMRPEGVPADRARCCYLHPVHAPDGTVVTDDFPKDHYHHRGISWMWPVVRLDGERLDLWALKGIRTEFVRWLAREARPASARLAVENGWFAGDRRVVKETVEMVVQPARGRERALDLTLTFEALGTTLELSGSPDKKGYGGLSFRFGPREGTVIRTERGIEAKDSDMQPHPWASLEGLFGGRPAGARVDIDPETPGFPDGWCLRHYGFLGVNYPGLETYRLEPGKPLRMRFHVTVFAGLR